MESDFNLYHFTIDFDTQTTSLVHHENPPLLASLKKILNLTVIHNRENNIVFFAVNNMILYYRLDTKKVSLFKIFKENIVECVYSKFSDEILVLGENNYYRIEV